MAVAPDVGASIARSGDATGADDEGTTVVVPAVAIGATGTVGVGVPPTTGEAVATGAEVPAAGTGVVPSTGVPAGEAATMVGPMGAGAGARCTTGPAGAAGTARRASVGTEFVADHGCRDPATGPPAVSTAAGVGVPVFS